MNDDGMPNPMTMCETLITPRQWVTFYKNLWMRNLIARTIDMQTAAAEVAQDKDQPVQDDETRQAISAADRLERRKMKVSVAVEVIASIDAMLAIIDDAELAKLWSAEATKLTPDVPVAGDACFMPDGVTEGTMQDDPQNPGTLVCIATVAGTKVEAAPVQQADQENKAPGAEAGV